MSKIKKAFSNAKYKTTNISNKAILIGKTAATLGLGALVGGGTLTSCDYQYKNEGITQINADIGKFVVKSPETFGAVMADVSYELSNIGNAYDWTIQSSLLPIRVTAKIESDSATVILTDWDYFSNCASIASRMRDSRGIDSVTQDENTFGLSPDINFGKINKIIVYAHDIKTSCSEESEDWDNVGYPIYLKRLEAIKFLTGKGISIQIVEDQYDTQNPVAANQMRMSAESKGKTLFLEFYKARIYG